MEYAQINQKSFLIFDRREISTHTQPIIGTFNPLETRSMNEIFAIIFTLLGIKNEQRELCTISFRNCSDLIYISSPCELMGQDDVSAYVVDRNSIVKGESDQFSAHGEFERLDSIQLQHINPMPLFTTNRKDIGQLSRRGQSTEIPMERVHLIPKFQEMNEMSRKFNKFKAIQANSDISMIPKGDENDGSVKKKMQKYWREKHKVGSLDFTVAKEENDKLKYKIRELESAIRKEQQNFMSIEGKLMEQNKIVQLIKSKCDEDWELRKNKIYAEIYTKHMPMIESKIIQRINAYIKDNTALIDEKLVSVISDQLKSIG